MGRSISYPYSIHVQVVGYAISPMVWYARTSVHRPGCPADGAPTIENLDKWVKAFEKSTEPGGTNEHTGRMVVTQATITRNQDRHIMATWLRSQQRPMFQVVN